MNTCYHNGERDSSRDMSGGRELDLGVDDSLTMNLGWREGISFNACNSLRLV